MMREFFIVANSFAAPFVSDTSTQFVEAETALAAFHKFKEKYTHPCGLFSANIYADANAYHKQQAPLAKWRSNAAAGRAGDPKEGVLEL